MAGIDNNTLLYLRGDSFKDLSFCNREITNNKCTIIPSDSCIDGSIGGVYTPYTEEFKLSEFTLEGDFWVVNQSICSFIFCLGGKTGYYFGDLEFGISNYSINNIGFSNINSTGIQSVNPIYHSGKTVKSNSWNHLAITYKDKKVKLYLDGELMIEYNNITLNYRGSSYSVGIGYRGDSSQFLGCKFKNIRISNIARYTEDFTPPTQPYNSIEINTLSQTATNINFSLTKLGQEVINKVEVLVNGKLSQTYIEGYDNISYVIDKSLCSIGNNDITIKVTYDDNYAEEKVLTHTHTVENLPTFSNLIQVFDRQEVLNNSLKLQKDSLRNILASKNVEVSEEDKMSILIDKVNLLGDALEPTLYLYNEGDECVDVTGGWALGTKKGNGYTTTTSKGTTSFNFSNTATGTCSVYATYPLLTSKMIDLSNYSTITIMGYNTNSSSQLIVAISTYSDIFGGTASNFETGKCPSFASIKNGNTNITKTEIDITNVNGSYYIICALYNGYNAGSSTGAIYSVMLS